MMETLALSSADNQNNQTLHVAAAAGVLDNHHHSPVEEEQMMNLSDMTDLSQEIQEDMVVTMPVAKEILLISLVSQEQALYNPKHENYRNTHRKDMKWLEISEQLGWTELQCKAKWKAMRDQYCRELKRSKFNNKLNVKWKYFKELDFLRPYALARNYRPRLPPAINTNTNNNNNNSFICSTITNNNNGITNVANNEDNNVTPKFTTIKIEGSTTINFATCDFSSAKSDTSNNLTEEQLSSVLQQQTDEHNWTYITGSNNSSNNNTRLDNHSLSDTQHLLSTHHQHSSDNQHHQTQTTDEALYNVLVDCMGQIQEQQQQHQQQHQQEQLCQQQQTTPNNEDEDDDPIHTFLNIESYFEKELIGLIRNEDMLYNNFNPNYRNVKLKLEAWDEIARKLKKTVKQCRLKWKALRDQFIREHKRLKSRENSETLPRWKHYDALSFLQKFIKHKGSDYITPKNLLELAKNKLVDDMDDGSSSPLQQMSAVSDDQGIQQQSEHPDNLCVSTGSVGGYDDMDIDNYIIGDSGSVVDDHNETDDHDPDNEDRKSQQEFSVFSNHNTNISMGSTAMDSTNNTLQQTFKEEHVQLQSQHLTEAQQQHISMPSLDLNDNTTPNDLLNSNTMSNSNNNNSPATNQNNYQNPLNNSNNITRNSTVPSLDICSGSLMLTVPTKPPPLQPAPTTTEASTNTPSSNNNQQQQDNNFNISNNLHQQQANANVANNLPPLPPPQEEDEVGAFFKSVAMKIRNANLSQVALTDLEIDILRVINNALRNH